MTTALILAPLLIGVMLILGIIAEQLAKIYDRMAVIKPFDPMAPANSYGEGLVDGIQNAIARGQRGINTNDH